MSEYAKVKGNKLRLKGETKPTHKKKKRKHVDNASCTVDETAKRQKIEDTAAHGGWWAVSTFTEISGCIALEFGDQIYMKSLDDGSFTLGDKKLNDEPPSPEEIFTAIRINDDKIALKSGYGEFLKVEKNGEVTGRSDACSSVEQWEPVFEEGKLALLGYNGCFMSAKPEDDSIVATSQKAGPDQFVRLRCQQQINTEKDDVPKEEMGNIRQIELNYVKKFQKFQDKKTKLNSESIEEVKKAKHDGSLHEVLLDRRSKMKADRYCK